MKKILFVHSSSELYGSDRSLLNLLKNLDKNSFDITVILPENGPLVEVLKEIKEVNIIIKEIAVLRRKNLSFSGVIEYSKSFISSLVFFKNVIKENKIDIVYSNTSVVFPGGIIAKMLGKKSIWHVREIISNKYERKIVSIIINLFSDVIIANSKATANTITNNKKKVRVVYNAIEGTTIPKLAKAENKKDGLTIGMAGRINRWKGQKLFVDMAEKILMEKPDVKFIIAGDVYKGEIEILNDLKRYIKEKGIESSVKLLGQISDMDSFYNSLDIFILPSIKPEPFGLVVIEAMDREIPVVATNHGGPVEIIDNGENGYLVDYKDCKEMSERVLELIENKELRHKIAKNGREKREKVFTIKTYVENISKIINSL